MHIEIGRIVIDPTLQIRDEIDEETVVRYAESFEVLPPLDVFETPDGYLLADGVHRYTAARRLRRTEVAVTVHQGSYADAVEYATMANLRHGKPLSRDERNDGVSRLHELHPEWPKQRIADLMGLDPKTVANHLTAEEVRTQVVGPATDRLAERHLVMIHGAPKEEWHPLVAAAAEQGWSREETARAVKLITEKRLTPSGRSALLSGEARPSVFGPDGTLVPREPTYKDVKEEVHRQREATAGGRMLKRLLYQIDAASRWPMADLLTGLTAWDRRDLLASVEQRITWLTSVGEALARDPRRPLERVP